jgi:DNA-binding MarR family transcriptional regulator
MPETPPKPADNAMTPQQAAETVKMEDLAEVAAGMNRFLAKFAKLQPFESNMSVAEWLFLMILAVRKEGRAHHQAFLLGFPVERVQKISDTLIQSGLVSSAQSDDPARPGTLTSITDAGTERLNNLNAAILPLVVKALTGKERTLVTLRHDLHILLRAVM